MALGWETTIIGIPNEDGCIGWITRDCSKSCKNFFAGNIISCELNGGYPNTFTISMRTLREFCNDKDKQVGLTKSIYGSYDFTQPFDPQIILNAFSDKATTNTS